MSDKGQVVIAALLADAELVAMVGERININQSEQEDYDYPYLVVAFSEAGGNCRDGSDESGEMLVEVYATTYKVMRAVAERIKAVLNNKRLGEWWFENIQGEFDKVGNDVNGISIKELTFNYFK